MLAQRYLARQSSPLHGLRLNMLARLRLVWNVPAEIHLDGADLAVADREDFGVAEALAAATRHTDVRRLVGDEHAVATLHGMDVIERLYGLAVGPSHLEIGCAIERVVERAGEAEVVREQRLDHGAILGGVGLIASLVDIDVAVGHPGSPQWRMNTQSSRAVPGRQSYCFKGRATRSPELLPAPRAAERVPHAEVLVP